MPRKKVNFAFIENATERKASYKKRQNGFLKKAHELNTLCDVEIAIIVYSPYHDEPLVFPNYGAAINTFTNFREQTTLEQSKNMVTQEEFTRQRIKKMEKQLVKVKKENRVKEFTNQMYELLNGKDIPANMHIYDLNDLSYVINQNLKKVREAIKMKAKGEGSTSNAPQSIVGPMVPGGTNSEGPEATLFAPTDALKPMVPLVAPSTVPGGTNSEGPKSPLLVSTLAPVSMVPPMASSIVPSVAPAQVPQSIAHLVAPLRTPPRTVPLVDSLCVLPPPSVFSQIFPPMVPQMYPPIPYEMALRTTPRLAPPVPPATMASSMTAPPVSAPVFFSMTPQVDASMNMPLMDASMQVNNYENHSVDFPRSPALSELFDWNNDKLISLSDDQLFNNMNVQDPNGHNNNNNFY